MDERVARYLEHVRFEKRLAERTSTLYALDLQKLSELALAANVDLAKVQTSHVRRWVAQMHSGGRSGRGIALILSGWRAKISLPTILSKVCVRPKFQSPCQKPWA